MRIAILYEDKNVFVEFSPKVFKKMLKTYMGLKSSKKIDEAFEKIIKDLKNQTKYA